MRKLLTALFLTLYLTAATASGGDAGDPLISLSYLEGDFSQALEALIESRLDAAGESPAGMGNTTLNEGDVLRGPAGLAFTLLGGDVQASGGTVIDVTEGREVASGLLERNHRYIVAEESSVDFRVASPTAVASWEGPAVLERSEGPDYYAAARALRAMDLFRGSGSGIGEGFDLHLVPTRGEGLVMFIRLLGEEADALACTDSHPFQDVPAWLDRYAAWAWAKGYSNGVSASRFDPDQPISAVEYVELLLRALGYSTAGEDDYAAALERALDCGLLNEAELALLQREPFRRAHVAYVSYYSLETPVSGTSQTLAQRLSKIPPIEIPRLS